MSNQSPNANSRDQQPQGPFSKNQERREEDVKPVDEIWSPGQETPGTTRVAAEDEGGDELDSAEDDEFDEADDEDDEGEDEGEDEETDDTSS